MWSSTILTSINRDIIVPITNLIVGEELDVIEEKIFIMLLRRKGELVSISPKKPNSSLDYNIEEFEMRGVKHECMTLSARLLIFRV